MLVGSVGAAVVVKVVALVVAAALRVLVGTPYI